MEDQMYLFKDNVETNHLYTETPIKYQIKKFDDISFNLTFELSTEHDAYEKALEQLGYFIVPENLLDGNEIYGN